MEEQHHAIWVAFFQGSKCVCVRVCVCGVVVVAAVWCVVVVSLAQGLRVLSSSPTLRQFSILFSTCLPPAPPVHSAVIGYLAFAGIQIKAFSHESAMVRGTSGAYITCCEDRLVLLREFLARL